jgi:hypothetical protein
MKNYIWIFFLLVGCSSEVEKCHIYSHENKSMEISICGGIISHRYILTDYYDGTTSEILNNFLILKKIKRKNYDVFIIKEFHTNKYTFLLRYVRWKNGYNVSFYFSEERFLTEDEAIDSFYQYRNSAIINSREFKFEEVRIPFNLFPFKEI